MAHVPSKVAQTNRRVAAVMTFAAFLGLGFVLPFLPLFMRDLGVTDSQRAIEWSGFLLGLGPLVAGLLAPFWGRQADLRGFKRLAIGGLLCLGLAQIVAALATSPWHVFVSRVLAGVFGGLGPLGVAMAAADGESRAGRAIGGVQAAQILAAGLGPLLGGVVASAFGARAAFVAAAICCFVAAVFVAVVYVDRRPPAHDDPEAPRRHILALPGALALVLVMFFANFAARSFTPILPDQLEALGVARRTLASNTGVLISLYSVFAAVSAFLFGSLASRFDPARLVALSLSLTALVNLPMGSARGFPEFLAIGAVLGLVSGGALTLGYSVASARFDPATRSAALGWLSGASLFGGAIAPAVAGVVSRAGLPAVYAMNAAVCALIAALALSLSAKRPR